MSGLLTLAPNDSVQAAEHSNWHCALLHMVNVWIWSKAQSSVMQQLAGAFYICKAAATSTVNAESIKIAECIQRSCRLMAGRKVLCQHDP